MKAVGGVFDNFRNFKHFKDFDCCSCAMKQCDGMCCNDPFCREDKFDHDNRFVFCVCWDRLRRCWVNPRTGFCVDLKRLTL